MIIVYRPADGEERHFDARSVRTSEAQIVERTTDMRWSEIKRGFSDDDPTVLRGIVWVLLKRETPTLRWADFDPTVDELFTRLDAREIAAGVADVQRLPEDKRDRAMAELRFYAVDEALVDEALATLDAPPKETAAEGSPSDA